MVRAKFKIHSVTKTAGWQEQHPFIYDVKAYPVTGGSDENKNFYASTPSGEITIGGVSESVANQFVPGKEYYLDFTPAELEA